MKKAVNTEIQPEAEKIRVRIAEAVPKVSIRGFDLQIYETRPAELKFVASSDKTSEWDMKCQDGHVKISKTGGLFSRQTFDLLEPVVIKTPVGFLDYADHPYREELQVYSSGSVCDVVNNVDLEKYLDGLVNAEFSSHWNEESVAAQVIAARTYAYYQIQESRLHKSRRSLRFDLDATVKDQVYSGFKREDFHSSQIVEKTKGLILITGDNQPLPLKAFYHSTCGGLTELPEHVWGGGYQGFNKVVRCPYCSSSPRFKWSLDIPTPQIAESIVKGAKSEGSLSYWPKTAKNTLEKGRLLDIKIRNYASNAKALAGRVFKVITVWGEGKKKVELPISPLRFRHWLGIEKMRSTWFQVSQHRVKKPGGKNQNEWHFEGRGFGHGVGMCQWGAKVMGERGYKVADILKFYYPDAIIRKMW